MIPYELRIDIFERIEKLLLGRVKFIMISPVYDELKRLSRKHSKVGRQALFALKLAKRCQTMNVRLNESESVDDSLIRVSKEIKAIVATTDLKLKKRLRDMGVPVIYLRGKSRLEIDGVEPAYG
jgi:rRNA-processing protein FCF1